MKLWTSGLMVLGRQGIYLKNSKSLFFFSVIQVVLVNQLSVNPFCNPNTNRPSLVSVSVKGAKNDVTTGVFRPCAAASAVIAAHGMYELSVIQRRGRQTVVGRRAQRRKLAFERPSLASRTDCA